MKVKIKKSGNSATLRIPSDVLKNLNLSIGEELSMSITDNGMSFEKIDAPREGWFDGICPITATNEAKMMEKDFGAVQNASLDDWDFGDEW
jgi:antitoxin component of MazEF toxin-antitoxin module